MCSVCGLSTVGAQFLWGWEQGSNGTGAEVGVFWCVLMGIGLGSVCVLGVVEPQQVDREP